MPQESISSTLRPADNNKPNYSIITKAPFGFKKN